MDVSLRRGSVPCSARACCCCCSSRSPARRSSYPPVVPGVELAVPARRGRASRVPHRVVVRHGLGAGRRRARPLGFQVTFFRVRPGIAESNPSAFAPRQVLFGHAAIAEPRARQAAARRALGARGLRSRVRARGPRRRAARRLVDSRRTATVYRTDVAGDGLPDAARARADAAAAAAGRARLQPQGAGSAVGELLLQPAAARGERRDRTLDGRERRSHRRGVVRPRVVERRDGRPRRAAGTGWASTSTTAAR